MKQIYIDSQRMDSIHSEDYAWRQMAVGLFRNSLLFSNHIYLFHRSINFHDTQNIPWMEIVKSPRFVQGILKLIKNKVGCNIVPIVIKILSGCDKLCRLSDWVNGSVMTINWNSSLDSLHLLNLAHMQISRRTIIVVCNIL